MITSFLSVLSLSFLATAAPHPMMGSSRINTVQSGTVFSQMGFQVSKIPADWILKNPIPSESKNLEIGSLTQTVLSFNSEKVSPKTDLEKYVRQYLRDYNHYGFEVIGLQSLKQSPLNSIIVDLSQKNRSTRSRQVFYKKDDQIVMATCLDSFEKFDKTILQCNAILETYQWR